MASHPRQLPDREPSTPSDADALELASSQVRALEIKVRVLEAAAGLPPRSELAEARDARQTKLEEERGRVRALKAEVKAEQAQLRKDRRAFEKEQLAARKELDRREAAVVAREEEQSDLGRELERERERLHEQAVALERREFAASNAGRDVELAHAALRDREEALRAASDLPQPTGPTTDDAADGRWNLELLEQLVRQEGQNHPDRLDEWQDYVVSLRSVAGVDGMLPSTVDGLVVEVFGDLLRRR